MKNLTNKISIILFAIILLSAAIIKAAPGDLDTTFNGSGKSILGFGRRDGEAIASATQSDGKVVVAVKGNSDFNPSAGKFAVIRFNTDGTVDSTFGFDGRSNTYVGLEGYANDVKIQPDGKIVVAGVSRNILNSFTIVRYNSNGSLDTTFGNNGIVATQTTDNKNYNATGLALQTDGKIIIGGQVLDSTNSDFAVARYNSNGSLDTTFGVDGFAITSVSTVAFETVTAIGIQGDGKIVLVGNTLLDDTFPPNQVRGTAIVRYNSNGTLDSSFGNSGITGSSGDGYNYIEIKSISFQTSLSVLTPPKIVVSGFIRSGSTGQTKNAIVIRFNSNGTPDTSFGMSSRVIENFNESSLNDSSANFVFVQNGSIASETRILIAGYSNDNVNTSRFAIARYLTNGAKDTTFGVNGVQTTEFNTFNSNGNSIALQAGKIVVSGSIGVDIDEPIDVAVVRYNSDGTLDTTFDDDGKWVGNVITAYGKAENVVVQSNGKMIVSGFGAVFRYNDDGTLDTTFNNKGFRAEAEFFGGLAVQSDGKVLVSGSESTTIGTITTDKFKLTRLNTNGKPDATFGSSGEILTQVGSEDAYPRAVAVQTNGKILVAGYTRISGTLTRDYKFAIVRYNSNGLLDTTFGSNGIVISNINSTDAQAQSISILSNGKILIGGNFVSFSILQGFRTLSTVLAQYNSNGSLDTTFGSDGVLSTGVTSFHSYKVKLQSDGKILVPSNFGSQLRISRFNADGSSDSTFGINGIGQADFSPFNVKAGDLAIQPNGKILVCGSKTTSDFNEDTIIARFNVDGSLDSSFTESNSNSYGDGGKITIDLGVSLETADAIALDSQNRPIIVGESGRSFSTIRLLPDLAPTAANVSISGRVFSPYNRGLSNAIVTLTDSSGQIHTTRTSSFGYFRFNEIEAGQTVIIGVRSKRFQFDSQVVSVNEQLEGLNFVPVRENK